MSEYMVSIVDGPRTSGRSFRNKKNNSGPNNVPFGTPEVTGHFMAKMSSARNYTPGV